MLRLGAIKLTLGLTVVALVALAVSGVSSRAGSAAGLASGQSSEVAARWFDLAYSLTRSESASPPVASRAFAYAGVTLYEAVLPGMPQHKSLSGQLNGELSVPPPDIGAEYNWPLVANAALATVMPVFYKSEKSFVAVSTLKDEIRGELGEDLPRDVVVRSEERGRSVGVAVIRWALGDGYESLKNCAYAPAAFSGAWRPTPPANALALEPCWGRLRPFVMKSVAEYRPPPPPAFSESSSSDLYRQAREVYDVANALTPEQRAIAAYWADAPGTTGTPPGHSIAIATQLIRERGKPLDYAAEAYARVGLAVADAFISCWEAKYEYNYLRPVTYIQLLIDPEWLPVLGTPPFPEYTSGHSVQSGAAAEALAAVFGDGPFTDRTHEGRGLGARSFANFGEAAQEAALSRLYGGIHFRPAIDIGINQGEAIGRAVNALEWRN
jgi:PAP2 superfamily